MFYRDICRIFGIYIFWFTSVLIVPLGVSIYYEYWAPPEYHPQPHGTIAFVETIAVSLILGFIFNWIGKGSTGSLYRREGIFIVVLIWVITPAIAALPFLFSGTLKNPVQAYFEATSGLTTTGSSVMHAKKYNIVTGKEEPIQVVVPGAHDVVYVFRGTIDPVRDPKTGTIIYEGVEAVGKGVIFWRSFMQWLGGMGIVVLLIAVLPTLGVGGRMLAFNEMSGPIKDALTPRIKETASLLWKIYVGLTILGIVFLMMTNIEMPFFDALTVTFSALSTGGFSVRNSSIGYYNNAYTDWVVIAIMILGSINFSLYFYALQGKFYRIYDRELILYFVLLCTSCGLGAYFLIGTEKELLTGVQKGIFNIEEAIRYAAFQIVSAHTTAGFVTANYDIWPYIVQVLMVIAMYFGGMAGSTSAGIKIIRLYLLFRLGQFCVESLFRPESVRRFRMGASEIDTGASLRILCFFLIIVGIATTATVLLIFDGIDPETAFGVVACNINNVGFAFRAAGPTQSSAFMSNFALNLNSFLMILSRLEFFAVLAVLVPAFWRQRS